MGERGKKYSRSSRQSVRIFYREIGAVDSGMLEAANTATKLSTPLLHPEASNTGQPQNTPHNGKGGQLWLPASLRPGGIDGSVFVPIDKHPPCTSSFPVSAVPA